MGTLKRIAGLFWMALGPLAIYFLARTALVEIAKNPVMDTMIQWGVFVVIFIPIAFGLVVFGWYVWKGEYATMPTDTGEGG
ncbi:MAG: hypothetical protein R2818_13915 [Flavobacteriales bacterium]